MKILNWVVYTILILVMFLAMVGLVSALANCWTFTTESTCTVNPECRWHTDPWGSWCEQKGCWNYYDNESCRQADNSSSTYFINKSCAWNSMSSSWCTGIDCWTFNGNATGCSTANTTYNLQCEWDAEVDQWGSPCNGPPEKGCWGKMNQSACQNTSGCAWGMCNRKSCWDYTSSGQAVCEANMGSNGKNCQWKTNSWGTECMEKQCWNYNTSTHCASDNCTWQGSYCTEKSCGDFSGTNVGSCVNNTVGVRCSWDSANSLCNPANCWNLYTQSNCIASSGCTWETYTGGWCGELGCWSWDGNNASCVNMTLHPTLNCTVDNTSGRDWCYENMAAKSCSSITNQPDCSGTFYCFWNETASACRDPIAGVATTEFVAWNPGCYIFDTEPGVCQNTTGCYNTSPTSACFTNATIIPSGQLNCSFFTNQTICNSMPMLSTCCKWQGSTCVPDKLSQTCHEEMEEPPEGAYFCEDYVAYTDNATCLQIAGSPWYMPCYWNTTLERCSFKMYDVFGSGERNIGDIDNEKSCIAAGGSWLKDTYTSSNDPATAVQLSMGRCDFSFGDLRTCDKECHACEFKTDKTNWSSEKKAKDACLASKSGICEFKTLGSQDASGRWGKCEPREAFKGGMVSGDCRSDCSACSYTGDPTSSSKSEGTIVTYDACLAPSCYCDNSPAKCKWIADPAHSDDESYGRCGEGSEKTCADRCDKCYSENPCKNEGGKKGNTSAAAVCQWNNNNGLCGYLSNSSQMEVCWNGIDDNGDNKIDCADSKCYSDDFCGGGYMFESFGVDCFIYNTNQTACENAGCAWVNEGWGSWCDMKGAVCWKRDGTNESWCEGEVTSGGENMANATCEWHSGFGGMCEQDWVMGGTSSSCMAPTVHNNRTACLQLQNVTYNCTWVEDSWCKGGGGGWCDPNWAYQGSSWVDCPQYDDDGATACNTTGTADSDGDYPCKWYVDAWCQQQGAVEAGHCDHMSFACMQFDNNQSGCTDMSNETYNHTVWCNWDATYNICNSKMMSGGSGSCWTYTTQTTCESANGCNWKSGFCDPKGFGGEMMAGMGAGGTYGGGGDIGAGGAMASGGLGMQCKEYDGNQTNCENVTGCGWFEEPWPFCDINFGSSCPQYSYNRTTGCLNESLTGGRCMWHSTSADGETGFCDEKPLECYWNTTLQNNLVTCGANVLCDNTSGSCTPICFNSSLQSTAACSVNSSRQVGDWQNKSVCRWMTGWCNPKMAAQFFKGMEMSAPPKPLGADTQGDAPTSEVDILDFGMKDMGKAYGFGIRLLSLVNSSACNGVKLSSGVSGVGKNTTKFYWFLDTDGNSANNCNTTYNSSLRGFEFYIKKIWAYDSTTGSVSESQAAYRCSEGVWVLAEIKVGSERSMMCSKMEGAMVGIDMAELEKFSELYISGGDIRVAVASANVNGNYTHPSDQAAPGWATPGAYDFDVDDFNMFKMENDVVKKAGKAGMDKGYVDYADEADCWIQSGCGNYSCKGHPYCDANNYGVEAAGFTDSRVPKLEGVMKETYPDSAFISYFTNKPSNGTLKFYRNDSTCASGSLNDTIYDIGVGPNRETNVSQYGLWHIAEIYNDGGSRALDYNLLNDTAYYFKIEICDENGKCGESKCSKFVTEHDGNCPACEFISKIKVPTGWNVFYDLDDNGVYEHWQGHIVKAEDGMLTNYTTGRRANILLNTSNGTEAMEFLNVTLTKLGMSPKIRDVDDASDLKNGTTTTSAGTTIGYVGMIEDAKDKIVNNLYPKACRINIPKGGTTCNQLWHCNSSGGNCVDRTANASLISNTSDICTWQIPYCEFSMWAGGQPGTGGGSSSSSSSGGGGVVTGGGAGGAAVAAKEVKKAEAPAKKKEKEVIEEVPVEEAAPEIAAPAAVPEEKLAEAKPPSKLWETIVGLSWLWATLVIVIVGAVIYFVMRKREEV